MIMNNSERNISLIGKSGHEYYGKIYDKSSDSNLAGQAIVCLSNTRWEDNHWQHHIRDIYNDAGVRALQHFKERDDISHLILIPVDSLEQQGLDVIDDLRRQYLHK
jgi:hypothetical protein